MGDVERPVGIRNIQNRGDSEIRGTQRDDDENNNDRLEEFLFHGVFANNANYRLIMRMGFVFDFVVVVFMCFIVFFIRIITASDSRYWRLLP